VPIEQGLNLNVDILDILDEDGKMRFEDALTDWRYASTEYFSTFRTMDEVKSAAAGAAKVIAGFIWGVSPLDPTTFAVVALILVGVTVLASLVPALRAVRLNPVTALRE